MDAGEIVRLLAEPDRRRVFAAMVLGATTIADIRTATGLDTRAAATALERLVVADLVLRGAGGEHFIVDEILRQAAIASAPPEPSDDLGEATPDEAKVLRAFVRDGRLESIPAQHSKRLVILNVLAQEFDPGRRYTEREVNQQLRHWHDDTASLRRYLVDEGFLEREGGVYWRTGGSVDV